MSLTNQQKNFHLLWRAGFGPTPMLYANTISMNPKIFYAGLLKQSLLPPAAINVINNEFDDVNMFDNEMLKMQNEPLREEQKREIRKKSREGLKKLNIAWLNQMTNGTQQLREKMSLFWHGHFATRTINIMYQQQLLHVMRKEALGNFGSLLKEVSKSASMINFLNNNQNRKGHPNENFAREVMELFTLGRGHYTENDIKEAARAFTGWGANAKGEFIFRDNQHDTGEKTFLGKTGNFNGDDILNILLAQKQTAQFITEKIYKYFVNEQPEADKLEWLATRLYKSNYSIEGLMTDIFTSDWFYTEKNIGVKIKSPVELIIGIRRILPMEIENEQIQLLLQRLLGQILFYPPNVAGWPGGKNWIDSSTLMMRMRIPQLIFEGDNFDIKPKDDDDQMMGMKDSLTKNSNTENTTVTMQKSRDKANKGSQQIVATINWPAYIKQFDNIPRAELIKAMSNQLFQTKSTISLTTLKNYTNADSKESFIKTATIQLMSTPEYQLC